MPSRNASLDSLFSILCSIVLIFVFTLFVDFILLTRILKLIIARSYSIYMLKKIKSNDF